MTNQTPKALTAAQALDHLERIKSVSPRKMDAVLSVEVYAPGTVGGSPTVPVIGLRLGYDWDSGKLIIRPEKLLTQLTQEQVQAIEKSVRDGQSWHAYERYKEHKAVEKELSDQLASVTAQRDELNRQVQSLIGSNARYSIEMQIAEDIIDPYWDGERTPLELEYDHPIHDKIIGLKADIENLKAQMKTMQECQRRSEALRDLAAGQAHKDYCDLLDHRHELKAENERLRTELEAAHPPKLPDDALYPVAVFDSDGHIVNVYHDLFITGEQINEIIRGQGNDQ